MAKIRTRYGTIEFVSPSEIDFDVKASDHSSNYNDQTKLVVSMYKEGAQVIYNWVNLMDTVKDITSTNFLPLTGGTLTGPIEIKGQGGSVAEPTYTSQNPKIQFSDFDGQGVAIVHNNFDTHRSGAGLQIVGELTPTWFEAPSLYEGTSRVISNCKTQSVAPTTNMSLIASITKNDNILENTTVSLLDTVNLFIAGPPVNNRIILDSNKKLVIDIDTLDLPIANKIQTGVVKSSSDINTIKVNPNGIMSLNTVQVDLLEQLPTNDLILDCGAALRRNLPIIGKWYFHDTINLAPNIYNVDFILDGMDPQNPFNAIQVHQAMLLYGYIKNDGQYSWTYQAYVSDTQAWHSPTSRNIQILNLDRNTNQAELMQWLYSNADYQGGIN